jgi:hypothetical protein
MGQIGTPLTEVPDRVPDPRVVPVPEKTPAPKEPAKVPEKVPA